MNVIIVGCGRVGTALAMQLSKEDNNITVIDSSAEVVNKLTNECDCMGVIGNGASHLTQQKAGIWEADLLIAVTDSDELNMLCCIVAKREGRCKTIARIRNHQYLSEIPYLKNELGLAMVINPEYATAEEIKRVLDFPGAISIEPFAKGKVQLLKFRLPEKSAIAGMSIKDIMIQYRSQILFAIAQRGDDALILKGDSVVMEKDIISIIGTPLAQRDFFKKIGYKSGEIKDSLIIGGGEIMHYLAGMLNDSKISIKVIEEDESICSDLSAEYPRLTVVNTSSVDHSTMVDEGLESADSFLALTNFDENNILLSLFAKNSGSKKIITKLKGLSYLDVISHLDLDAVFSPMKITTDMIVRFVRSEKNTRGSNMENFYNIIPGKVEASEFVISEPSAVVGVPLSQMKIRDNVLISAITRDGDVIIPRGNDELRLGDAVVVVSRAMSLNDITDIIE